MPLSESQAATFSRYGMYPFNWIVDGKILASVYPTFEYLQYLNREENIKLAVNLTESPWDENWAYDSGIRCIHFPVRDMTVPDPMKLREIIESIDRHDGPVMIHCAAGIGRTGTVIGVYLVSHGSDPESASSTRMVLPILSKDIIYLTSS